MAQTNLSTKQKQTRTGLRLPWGGRWGREGLGLWDEQGGTNCYIEDGQTTRLYCYNTGSYGLYPVINHNGKEYLKKKESVLSESLRYIAETGMTL